MPPLRLPSVSTCFAHVLHSRDSAICPLPQHGSLPLANQQMAAALDYAGYAFHLEMGQGTHSSRHMASVSNPLLAQFAKPRCPRSTKLTGTGRQVLPDALRWLFATQAPPPPRIGPRL